MRLVRGRTRCWVQSRLINGPMLKDDSERQRNTRDAARQATGSTLCVLFSENGLPFQRSRPVARPRRGAPRYRDSPFWTPTPMEGVYRRRTLLGLGCERVPCSSSCCALLSFPLAESPIERRFALFIHALRKIGVAAMVCWRKMWGCQVPPPCLGFLLALACPFFHLKLMTIRSTAAVEPILVISRMRETPCSGLGG